MQPNNSQGDEVLEYKIISEVVPRWLRKMILNGAQIDLSKDSSGKKLSTLSISPFYLPRMKFFAAPDVKVLWREFCRRMLVMLYHNEKPPADFKEVMSKHSLQDENLEKILRMYKFKAILAALLITLSISVCVHYFSFSVILSCLGFVFLAGSLYWKYSFYMWQIRVRSFDPQVASVKRFMTGPWYLEPFK